MGSQSEALVDKKKPLTLVLKGIEAGVIWEFLRNSTSRAWANRKLGQKAMPREPIIIALTIVLCLGLGVIAAICIYGMHQGYNIKMKHKVTGPFIWDHRLDVILVPPK